MMRKLLIGVFIVLYLITGLYDHNYAEEGELGLTPEEEQWLEEHPVLYYAPDSEYAPYEYFEDGVFKGIISDYLVILEEQLGVDIQIIQTESWTQTINLAKAGEVDFIFLTKTAERSKYLDFTEAFVVSPNIILVNEQMNSNINAENLGAYRMGIIESYANAEYARLVYPEAETTEYPTIIDGLLDLSFGNIDAFLVDLGQGSFYIKELNISNLKFADTIDYQYKLSFGIPKGKDSLASILNKALASIPKEQRMAIMDQWIEFQYREWLNSQQIKWVAYLAAGILALAIGIFIWNRMLRRMVNQKTSELNQLNLELEHKVEDRTHKLQALNEELQASLDQLVIAQDSLVEVKKQAALGEIIAGVAHEVNTPVGNSITYTSFESRVLQELKEKIQNHASDCNDIEEIIDELTDINSNVLNNLNHAGDIIAKFKVLQVSQISKAFETLNLYDECMTLLGTQRYSRIAEGNVKVHLKIEKDLEFYFVRKWFEEIIQNLIDNSIKHGFQGKERGNIHIDIALQDTTLFLTYEDDGIGIPTVHKERVFDPFFTSEKTHHHLGLGLSVVYNIVVRHLNGAIQLESQEGLFTRFTLTLPEMNVHGLKES